MLDQLIAHRPEVDTNGPSIDDRVRGLTELIDAFRCTLHTILGPTGRHGTRLLSDEELERLTAELEFVDRREAVVVALHQAYRTLLEVELRCVGRFAGSTSDVMADLAAIELTPPPTGEVLVVRTLFGAEAVGAARQLARIGLAPTVTVLDPFADGSVLAHGGHDVDVSLTPSTPVVVRTNLALGGIPSANHRVLTGNSDAPETRRTAGDRRYGLVVIGDHRTREEVVSELRWVGTIVEPDALIVVNDVGDSSPEVQTALARYLGEPGATLRLIGTTATSAFLRAT